MTNRIMSDDEVCCLETQNEEFPPSCVKVRRIIASHRLLAAKLEKKKAALKDRGVIESVLEICEEERDALKARVEKLEGLLEHVTGEVPR